MRCCHILDLGWSDGSWANCRCRVPGSRRSPDEHGFNSVTSPNTTSSSPWKCSTNLFQLRACFTHQPQPSGTIKPMNTDSSTTCGVIASCSVHTAASVLPSGCPSRIARSGFARTALGTFFAHPGRHCCCLRPLGTTRIETPLHVLLCCARASSRYFSCSARQAWVRQDSWSSTSCCARFASNCMGFSSRSESSPRTQSDWQGVQRLCWRSQPWQFRAR